MANIVTEYLEYHEKYEKKYGIDRTLIMMQVGSFYELYATDTQGPDLQKVASILNIICTRKDKSNNDINTSNPYMLGFPKVAETKFVNILIENGYTIVVIDQVTPPPKPKREVVGVYSPGIYINGPQKPDNNYVIGLYIEEESQKNGASLICSGMVAVDITTGEIYINEAYATSQDSKYALDETIRFINGINPTEIVLHIKTKSNTTKNEIIQYLDISDRCTHVKDNLDSKYFKISYQNEYLKKIYKECGQIQPIDYLDLEKFNYVRVGMMVILDFVYDHNNTIINNLNKPEIYHDTGNMVLGNNAISQLNVIESNGTHGPTKYKSLFNVVNNTLTAMGQRFLKSRLILPLVSSQQLVKEYNYIETLILNKNYVSYRENLKEICDIERLERKMALECIHPYEFNELIQSYREVVKIIGKLKTNAKLKSIITTKNMHEDIEKIIEEAEGIFNMEEIKKHNLLEISTNIFLPEIYEDLDKLQKQINFNTTFMTDLCTELSKYVNDNKFTKKETTSISIKNTDRDGHYLVLTKLRATSLKKQLDKIKTITIGEYNLDCSKLIFSDAGKTKTKITFPHLDTMSEDMVELKEKIMNLNKKYYLETIRKIYNDHKSVIKNISSLVAMLDVLQSNAHTSKLYNYTKPNIDVKSTSSYIECSDLRHPIIERIIDYEYIPHNIALGKDTKGLLIFGLNASGKSSYMKAIGLCVIMAQAGMYVPASSCTISPYTTLYTRITGNDNLFKGLSSFGVEMLELKAILRRSSAKTLVIGDEICRGTEYISGNAIVATTILKLSTIGANFIFATHLHDIASMPKIKALTSVKCCHLSVSYDAATDTLIYDRKLQDGPGESVYGITVAKYIINDKDFMDTALEIKNELLQGYDSMISGKTSRYNSSIYIHECQICHKKDIKGHASPLETHHIIFQKEFVEGAPKTKSHINKNDKANLVVLCNECHDKIHSNKLDIEGSVMTSKGKKIIVKDNKKKVQLK